MEQTDEKILKLNVSGELIEIPEYKGNQIPFIKNLNDTDPTEILELKTIESSFMKHLIENIDEEKWEYLKTILDQEFNDSEIMNYLQYLGLEQMFDKYYPLTHRIKQIVNTNTFEQNFQQNLEQNFQQNLINYRTFKKKFEQEIINLIYDLYNNILKCVSDHIYIFENHKWKKLRGKEMAKDFVKYLIENNIIKKYYTLFNHHQKILLHDEQFMNFTTTRLSHMFYDSERNFIGKLDTDKYLLGFDNGVYDLKTHIFREGVPSDLISISVGYNYTTRFSNNHHDLLLFLKNIQPDEKKLQILLRETCECLSGNDNIKKTLMYHGINAGKSTYNQLIRETFGDHCGSFDFKVFTKSVNELNPELRYFVNKRVMISNWDSMNQINTMSNWDSMNQMNTMSKWNTYNQIKMRPRWDPENQIYVCPRPHPHGASSESLSASSESLKLLINCLDIKVKKFYPMCKIILDCDYTLPVYDHENDKMIIENVSMIDFPSRFVWNPMKENEIKSDPRIPDKVMDWKMDFMLLLIETYKQNFQ